MRILVVDDEKLLVKGIKFNLENDGYEVETAYDGAEAVYLAKWGTFADGEKPQNFYNQALEVSTTLSPHEALKEALAIEHQLGRRRKEIEDLLPHPDNSQLYSSRPIDIDLIFYGDAVIDTPKLTIPHPRMHLRRFVLQPMCEIAPCYKHPILNKTLTELLNECTDTSSCLCCSL